MFVVLYRWRLLEGCEESFIKAWREVTEFYLENFDSLGSRLHKGDDGIWYAYAQWKTLEQRENASENSEAIGDAFEKMHVAIDERYPEIILDVQADLLKSGYLA